MGLNYRLPKQKDNFTVWKEQLEKAARFVKKGDLHGLTDREIAEFLTIPVEIRLKAAKMVREGDL